MYNQLFQHDIDDLFLKTPLKRCVKLISLLPYGTLPVVRQVTEFVYIHSNDAEIVMNSKSEWTQPMAERVIITRELDELEERSGAREQGRRRARRARGGGTG